MPETSPLTSLRRIRTALRRTEESRTVTIDDAETLFSARGDELDRLLAVSSALRDDGLKRSARAGVITYSKKVFIPVTQLCRDRCHYCIFVDTPGGLASHGIPTYMSPSEILEVAREGARLGCKEALFTLGDRPEDRWRPAREWLDAHGYASTLDYIGAMARLVLEETGLLPHLNPGVMSWSELQRLRPVAPSMGMMLETTSRRLWTTPGEAHYGSPDKDPALRLQVLDDAGRSRIPFTTGVLLGIGETDRERAESLFAIRASHERFGHVQETIVQNFRAKPRTAMQNTDDLEAQEYAAAVAVARIVMGPDATVQAPPNLSDANELGMLLRAGIDDWGGVSPLTADFVNPERPWPEIDDLARLTARGGFSLRERLTAHPAYLSDLQGGHPEWVDERLLPHVTALLDPTTRLAHEAAEVVGRPWARDSNRAWSPSVHVGEMGIALRAASETPAGLSDAQYERLLDADGTELDELTRVADELRAARVGAVMTYVVNRNLDPGLWNPESNDLAGFVDDTWALGATELCIQGPLRDGTAERLIALIAAREPQLHLHAFRPAELLSSAAAAGRTLEEQLAVLRRAGLDSAPGTAARILDDEIRAELTGGTDITTAEWVDTIERVHSAGLPTTATMVYGHIESPAHQVAHLRTIAAIQDRTDGFTEFIPMPFVAEEAPIVPRGARAQSLRETRAVHAVARLMLDGRIDHIQAAWPKLGLHHARAALAGGADDVGGLLLSSRSGTAGTLAMNAAASDRSLAIADVEALAADLGRTARQRTTLYRDPSVERMAAARAVPESVFHSRYLPIEARPETAGARR